MIPVFTENTRGRDFVVGDIHGHLEKLHEQMFINRFDPAVDRLFSTGDLVDRGPDSDGVAALINEPWFHAVQGNHEAYAIECVAGTIDLEWYLRHGGAWMMSKNPSDMMDLAVRFTSMPLALEIEIGGGRRVGVVHATCPFADWEKFRKSQDSARNAIYPYLQLKAIRHTAQWSRDELMEGVAGIHAVIVGHTPKKKVTSLGNVFYVDTGCGHKGGKLSMIQIQKLFS
jgi:serine/threonine protein phosphatase 1